MNSSFCKTPLKTAPSRRLPWPFPALSIFPYPGSPDQRTSIPAGLFPTHGALCFPMLAFLHSQTELLQGQGLSLSLHPPLYPGPCPLGALGGWCAGGWVSADKGGSEAGPAWCEVWWSGPGWVVLNGSWWVWKGVVLWGPTLLHRSRSPRKPIDSLRDSRSLSYSPVEHRRPSPQPSPREQQSNSERVSRRGQRGDSRSPGHKRRRETPSPRPMRHRSSRSP